LSALTFIIILLLLHSNITVFLYSIQYPTFKNYTRRISPRARRYDTKIWPPLYLYPPEAGWPSYTPKHWVPILVASYDTHGLWWDYSYSPVTT
jgi:hypothetical protein